MPEPVLKAGVSHHTGLPEVMLPLSPNVVFPHCWGFIAWVVLYPVFALYINTCTRRATNFSHIFAVKPKREILRPIICLLDCVVFIKNVEKWAKKKRLGKFWIVFTHRVTGQNWMYFLTMTNSPERFTTKAVFQYIAKSWVSVVLHLGQYDRVLLSELFMNNSASASYYDNRDSCFILPHWSCQQCRNTN